MLAASLIDSGVPGGVAVKLTLKLRGDAGGSCLDPTTLSEGLAQGGDGPLASGRSQVRGGQAEQRETVDQRLARTLQYALLPDGLPVSPRARFAARYVAAARAEDAGGDWYDAVLLDGGTVVATVGDVIGSGVGAATAMGQLRSALTAYTLAEYDAAALFDHVDEYAKLVPGAAGTTACVVQLDPSTGKLSYATAGHAPPLVVGADGTARYLAPAPGRPFGIEGEPRTACAGWLGPGDVLVLYSDGALSLPGYSVGQRRARLIGAARSAVADGPADDVDGACERLLTALTRDQPPQDDLVLLVVRRLGGAVRPLRTSMPARPGQLSTLRQQLQDWMDGAGVGEQDAVSVQIAVGEAASNAVEHAYPPGQDGELQLSVSLSPQGDLSAEVSDRGSWRPPGEESQLRGRGLPLMRACMDSMDLSRAGPAATETSTGTGTGTTVQMRRRLRTPVGTVARGIPQTARRPRPEADFEVVADGDRVLLRLGGEVDLSTTEAIGKQIRAATRGNTTSTTVDLTRVTHLASAAVQLLFELANDGARLNQPVVLLVTAGSAADQVVSLTGLDQVAKVGRQAAGSAK